MDADLDSFTIIVASEPGGAEVVAAAAAQMKARPRLVLEGQAVGVFERRLGKIQNLPRTALSGLVPGRDRVLTGTSLNSDLERYAIAQCRQSDVNCVSYLDNWVNFELRFGINPAGERILPDEIWAGDEYALARAREAGLPQEKIKLIPNKHLDDVVQKITSLPAAPAGNILVLGEPLSLVAEKLTGSAGGFGVEEIELFTELFEELKRLQSAKGIFQVRFRPHPKEAPDKYNRALPGGNFSRSAAADFIDDIAWASTVIGIESIGLVYALLSGKRAISYIPTAKFSCRLPHEGIVKLKSKEELELHL